MLATDLMFLALFTSHQKVALEIDFRGSIKVRIFRFKADGLC
jgi:hypothetical protein